MVDPAESEAVEKEAGEVAEKKDEKKE